MLVKDITDFHDKSTRYVNKMIKRLINKDRFLEKIDYIDLKEDKFAVHLMSSGILSQNQINVSKHIYLLSERAYMRLTSRIFDDGISWKMYDH